MVKMGKGISRLALLAALGGAGLPHGAIGQTAGSSTVVEEPEALGTIVLSALRTASERLRSGVSVSVVTEDDLSKHRATALVDYLTRLPGVSMTTLGPFGNSAELRIRGLGAGYLTVLVDGIRVNDPSSPRNGFDFGSTLAADVGRVELLRGSQSALWGNSAVGGVLNISSLGAKEPGLQQEVGIEAGSYGTTRLTYGLRYLDDRAELALTATRYHSDGFSAAAAGTEPDGAEASRLSFAGSYKITDQLTLGGSLFVQHTDQDYDDWQADAANVQSRKEGGARVYGLFEIGLTQHQLEASFYRIRRSLSETYGSNGYDGRRLSLGYQGTSDVSDALMLVYGLDWARDRAEYIGGYGSLPSGGVETRTTGVFGQLAWSPVEGLDLSGTLRVDDDSHFGSFTTGRIALAWQANEASTISASVARGYRAPTIDERFGYYPGYGAYDDTVGNPDLHPETSWSYELGAEWAVSDDSRVSATLFRIAVDDKIAVNRTGPVDVYENISGASILKGIELAAAMPLSDKVQLTSAYTYTDGRSADGTRLTSVPYHTLALALEAALTERLSADLSLKHMGGWLNSYPVKSMPSFVVVGAQVNYDLSAGARAYLRVENLFDREYQVSEGYGTPGRSAYLGLEARF